MHTLGNTDVEVLLPVKLCRDIPSVCKCLSGCLFIQSMYSNKKQKDVHVEVSIHVKDMGPHSRPESALNWK